MNVSVNPIRMQRAEGEGRVAFSLKDGKTQLDELYQSGAAKIRLPAVHDGSHAEAVLINVSGGLTGGDRFSWQARLAPQTSLSVTTQACEKIYKATDNFAEIKTQIALSENAALSWLPQESILFNQSALRRLVDVDMAPTARVLVLESAVLGREAFGEKVTGTVLQDRWRIKVAGRLVHAEETQLMGDPGKTATGPARLGQMTAFASLVLIAPNAGVFLEPLRALAAIDGTKMGVSLLPAFQTSKLVARFAATNGLALRRIVIPAVELLNRQAMTMGGLPKVWRL